MPALPGGTHAETGHAGQFSTLSDAPATAQPIFAATEVAPVVLGWIEFDPATGQWRAYRGSEDLGLYTSAQAGIAAVRGAA